MEHRHETGLLTPVGPLPVTHFISVENEMGGPSMNAIAFHKKSAITSWLTASR
jgi:hypothetical protein